MDQTFGQFSRNDGPTGPPRSVQFGNSGRRPSSPSPNTPPFPHSAPPRSPPRSPESLPSWNGGQRPLFKNNDSKAPQRPSAVTSFVVSRNSGTSVTANVARFQDMRGTRSPPFVSRDVNIRSSPQSVPRSHVVPPQTQSPTSNSYKYQPVEGFNCVGRVEGHLVPPRTRSPPSASYNYHPVEDFDRFGGVESRLVTPKTRSPPSYNHHPVEDFDRSGGVVGLQAYQEPSRVSPPVSSLDSGRRTPVNYDDVQVALKQTREVNYCIAGKQKGRKEGVFLQCLREKKLASGLGDENADCIHLKKQYSRFSGSSKVFAVFKQYFF